MRSGKLPPQPDTPQPELLTSCEVSAIQSEREKLAIYRLALIENTTDLLTLLLVAKDKKMENLISNFYDGATFCGTALFLGAIAFGVTLNLPVVALTLVGGGLIFCANSD